MMYPGRILAFWFCLFASLAPAQAALSIRAPSLSFPPGTNRVQVPITVSGGDLVTDMVGIIQIGDGGPLVGGTAGPVITAVSYAGSIWAGAPGGFAASSTVTLPAQIYDPNVSLNVSGQKVPANGLLMTLTVENTGVPPGLYELKLACGVGPDTAFENAGAPVAASITNGLLVVGQNPPVSAVSPVLRINPSTNSQIQLSFPTEVGRNYRVQWRTNLVTGNWTEILVSIPGTGCDVMWRDDGSLTGQAPALSIRRFYRVRVGN